MARLDRILAIVAFASLGGIAAQVALTTALALTFPGVGQ